MPKSKQTYWGPKILRNRMRDREIRTMLRQIGWSIHRIWEHSLADPVAVAARLRLALNKSARKALKAS
jgi:DNA mismatch endonuclease (patch repair protein)